MNRRAFIGALTCIGGLVGLSRADNTVRLFSSKPTSALAYLTEAFNNYCKGTGVGRMPKQLLVSQELYNAVEKEFESRQRFTSNKLYNDVPTLKFKSVTMSVSKNLKNWDYAFGG